MYAKEICFCVRNDFAKAKRETFNFIYSIPHIYIKKIK